MLWKIGSVIFYTICFFSWFLGWNVSLEHRSSVKSLGYIYNNSQKYIVWVKIIDFYFMAKIIRILRSCFMKIFSTFLTVNISKLNFWLLIYIAKNFIWTTLKMILSIFRFFFCTLRFQIYKYCPIITNHTSMEYYLLSSHMMYKSQCRIIDLVLCS